MPIYVYVFAALIVFGAGASSGWKVRDWKAGNDIAESTMQAAKELASRNEKASGAAVKFEATREAQRKRGIVTAREVEREVKADLDCSVRELPAGLRDALTRAVTGDDGSGSADSTLPALPTSPASDVGRRGFELRTSPDGTAGLRVPTEGAR